MIQFQPICTSDTEYYQFMENLLVKSFPPDEYRQLEELRNFTDRKENFHNNIILEDGQPVGLITYWDFDRFYYVEHFAINPTLRNGGYGKRTLEHLCSQLKLPIVLEVELPIEDMAKRRINFYQRHGFTLWNKEYCQPPYKKGDNFLPMYLMVYGNLDAEQDFEKIKCTIHNQVYGTIA